MVLIMNLCGYRSQTLGLELLYGVDINSYLIRIETMYRRRQQHPLMHRQLMDFHLLGLAGQSMELVQQLQEYVILSSSLKANWQFSSSSHSAQAAQAGKVALCKTELTLRVDQSSYER